jgi:hypothetical protein
VLNDVLHLNATEPGVVMPYYVFVWTDLRLEKLAINGVDPDDFERVVMNPRSQAVSRSSGRPIALGRDARGAEIACVYEVDDDGITVYPITAFDTGK